jgi:hypothetical protein
VNIWHFGTKSFNVAEAKHFINTIKPFSLSYPTVLDIGDSSQANLNKELLTEKHALMMA